QAQVEPGDASAARFKAPIAQGRAELPLRHDALAASLLPALEAVVEGAGALPLIGAQNAAFLEPQAEGVLLRKVLGRRRHNSLGRRQALLLPLEAAFHRPGQEPVELAEEIVLEPLVLLLAGDRHVERNEVEPAPNRVVHRLEARPVVACNY